MKKTFLTSFITCGLLLGFNGQATEASVSTDDLTDNLLVNDEISAQNGVDAYLFPSNLSGRSHTSYTLTVSTNVSGIASFTFDPGIAGVNARRENGSGSRNFSQVWTTNGMNTFTTSAQVISPDYGPSSWFYGKAVITY